VNGEKRAHEDTRPLTGKHVDTHPPLRRVRGRTHFCQIAKRGHQDTSTRLDSFPLQNFQEKIGKFNERKTLLCIGQRIGVISYLGREPFSAKHKM
jgi:hypothetical protein